MDVRARVAVAAEHRMFAEGLELVLAGEKGFEAVGSAGTVAEAAEMCRRGRPDVLLLDTSLPG